MFLAARNASFFAALTAAVVLVGCSKKEKAGGESTHETTTTKAGGDDVVKPPEVAIGAERIQLYSGGKKVADKPEYSVTLVVPEDAKVGVESAAQVVLSPKDGWKLNEEYPYSLVITAPAGVSVAKASQEKADAVKWELKSAGVWSIGFTASSGGPKAFAAEFDFAVCTPATCNPYQETLAWNVEVK